MHNSHGGGHGGHHGMHGFGMAILPLLPGGRLFLLLLLFIVLTGIH